MHVTPHGVSLEYRDGRVLKTGIIPIKIFPKQKKLTPKNIRDIHRFIKFKNYALGKVFDKITFDKIKKQYTKIKRNLKKKE